MWTRTKIKGSDCHDKTNTSLESQQTEKSPVIFSSIDAYEKDCNFWTIDSYKKDCHFLTICVYKKAANLRSLFDRLTLKKMPMTQQTFCWNHKKPPIAGLFSSINAYEKRILLKRFMLTKKKNKNSKFTVMFWSIDAYKKLPTCHLFG